MAVPAGNKLRRWPFLSTLDRPHSLKNGALAHNELEYLEGLGMVIGIGRCGFNPAVSRNLTDLGLFENGYRIESSNVI